MSVGEVDDLVVGVRGGVGEGLLSNGGPIEVLDLGVADGACKLVIGLGALCGGHGGAEAFDFDGGELSCADEVVACAEAADICAGLKNLAGVGDSVGGIEGLLRLAGGLRRAKQLRGTDQGKVLGSHDQRPDLDASLDRLLRGKLGQASFRGSQLSATKPQRSGRGAEISIFEMSMNASLTRNSWWPAGQASDDYHPRSRLACVGRVPALPQPPPPRSLACGGPAGRGAVGLSK